MWVHAVVLATILFYINAEVDKLNALPSLHNSVSLFI